MRLRQQQINLLIKLFKMTQSQLKAFLEKELRKYYSEEDIINSDGYLCVDGDSNIGLVAHMDVSGRTPAQNMVYSKNFMTAIGSILGADDRAGIFMILQLLEDGYRPKIIFTEDEEIGCIGARKFVEDFEGINCKYLIQLDRRGTGCVFYDDDNQKFQEYVESFGFTTEIGSFSDISTLCPTFGCSGVNLGIGYYGEHTTSEYLNISHMTTTLDRVRKMLDDSDNAEWFEYEDFYANWKGSTHNYNHQAYGYGKSPYNYDENFDDTSVMINVNGKYMSLEEYYTQLGERTEQSEF